MPCLSRSEVIATGVVYHPPYTPWEQGQEMDGVEMVPLKKDGDHFTWYYGTQQVVVTKDRVQTGKETCKRNNPGVGDDIFSR